MKAGCFSCARILFLLALSSPVQALTLLFAGDLMLDDGPGKAIAAGRDVLTRVVPVLAQADYRIANLECSVATGGEALAGKVFTFRAAPATLDQVRGRFEAVSVANNHSGDFGKDAFLETLVHLRTAGIGAFGGGRSLAEAHAPLWLERHGLRVAVLGYNEFKPRSFEAGARHPGIAWSEDQQVIADIRAARRAGADVVIPFMHWGWEREGEADPRQRRFARRMIDAGASAVVGSHPHVTQGAEIYRGRPIVYSLGNFVFDGFEEGPGRRGWLLHLSLDHKGVRAWHTSAVRLDEEGIPSPAHGDSSPCGRRGDRQPRECVNP